MKTLKVCRIVSMIAFIALFLTELIMQMTRVDMNWWVIAILAALAILAPVNLRYSTKRERNPRLLSETDKGYTIYVIITSSIMIVLGITGIFVDFFNTSGSPWGYLAWCFAAAYQIFNSIILYRAKMAYEANHNVYETK